MNDYNIGYGKPPKSGPSSSAEIRHRYPRSFGDSDFGRRLRGSNEVPKPTLVVWPGRVGRDMPGTCGR